jgi:hypothetical protein
VNMSNATTTLHVKEVAQWCGTLGGRGAKQDFVQLERSCKPPAGRVESQCDGIGHCKPKTTVVLSYT